MILYTSHTFPEGAIKIESAVEHFLQRGIPYIAVTDHGTISNFHILSRITKNRVIKPIYGMELFLKTDEDLYARVIIYVKNSEGFKEIFNIYNRAKSSQLGFRYVDDRSIFNHQNLIFLFSNHSYCYLSNQTNFVDSISMLKEYIYLPPIENCYIHLLGDQTDKRVIEDSQSFGVNYLTLSPIYFLGKKRSELNSYIMRMRGYQPFIIDRGSGKFYQGVPFLDINSEMKIQKSLPFNLVVDEDIHAQQKQKFYSILGSIPGIDRVISQRRVKAELKIIEKSDLISSFTQLIEIKRDLLEKGINIYFTGDIEYFKISNLLGLTSTNLEMFKSTFFSYLKNITPKKDIGITLSLKHRDRVIEYLVDRFGKDHTSLLSTNIRWNVPSLIKTMGKVFSYNYKMISEILKYIPNNYRRLRASDIFRDSKFKKLLDKGLISKSFFNYGVLLDRSVRNIYPSKSTLILSTTKVKDIIPVREENGVNISPLTLGDITSYNFISFHINSSNLNKMINPSISIGVSDADQLIGSIMDDRLEFIPYFSYHPERVKLLQSELSNSFIKLALYLESGVHDLRSFDIDFKKDDFSSLKSELEESNGKVVFREQLVIVIDKLYKGVRFKQLRRKVANFRSLHQLISYLSKVKTEDSEEKVKLLKRMVMPQALTSSIIDHANKIFLAIYALKKRDSNFRKFIYSNIVTLKNSDYNNRIIRDLINRYNLNFDIERIEGNIKQVENRVLLPLNIILGVSKDFADSFKTFIKGRVHGDIIDLIKSFDRDRVYKHQFTLITKMGFFDPLESNRLYLLNLIDRFYRDNLFSRVDRSSDFKEEIKDRFSSEIIKIDQSKESHLVNFFIRYFDYQGEWNLSEVVKIDDKGLKLLNDDRIKTIDREPHIGDPFFIFNGNYYNKYDLFSCGLKIVISKSDYNLDLHNRLGPFINQESGIKLYLLEGREIETDIFIDINYQNFLYFYYIFYNLRVCFEMIDA